MQGKEGLITGQSLGGPLPRLAQDWGASQEVGRGTQGTSARTPSGAPWPDPAGQALAQV